VNQKWNYYAVKETTPADEAFHPLATSKCRLVVN
jgi:branched-chain amino acid transport system substrate-binding protein